MDNVYDMLEEGSFESLDEVDAKLDKMMREFFDQIDQIRDYYKKNGLAIITMPLMTE